MYSVFDQLYSLIYIYMVCLIILQIVCAITYRRNSAIPAYNKHLFIINHPSHSATSPTGGVDPIAIGVPIAVVSVLTGAVTVILIACVVWRFIRRRKKFFPVSILLVVTKN